MKNIFTRLLVVAGITMLISSASGRTTDSISQPVNSSEKLLMSDSRLAIGGYGEVHYNQPLSKDQINNGKLDVHRLVLLFGYNFTDKTQFITEIEFEHVKEVYIEQAFLQHKINSYLNFRAGLLLIPMGIINEYHEPTTFNGVERPSLDNVIAPTTWREIGLGFTGNIIPASIKYQAYLVNGFNGYDGEANFSGKGLRSGRQKGAESYISSPNFAGKVSYYGMPGLNLGLSGYVGKTQSTLYHGIDKTDDLAKATADSSVLGMSMIGVDARYNRSGLQLRGQYYLTALSNTLQYNNFTAIDGTPNDVGSKMNGYYIEAGYNVFRPISSIPNELIPFIRFEQLNSQAETEAGITHDETYDREIITTGLTLKLTQGAVLKADLQFVKTGSSSSYSKTFNAGFGVMF